LAWVKARGRMKDTAMTNPELWQQTKPDDDLTDVRLEKIERLKAAIANGTYHVSAEDLAEKMIESMLERKLPENSEENN
jgi:flagellar biosynthesis anti-sigma factor FlgM